MQILLTAFGILVACSLVAVLVGPIVLDAITDEDEPGTTNASVDDAIEEAFREEAEANPDDAAAAAAYANYLANTGNSSEAITWYERALVIDSANAEIRFAFARSLVAAGFDQDAELQFQRSIELEPDNEQAHFYLAELYDSWDPRRVNDALDEYERTIEANPESFVAEQAVLRIDELIGTPSSPSASPTEEIDG